MENIVDNLGRIKIPKEIRQELELEEGYRVEISVENDRIVITKIIDLCSGCPKWAQEYISKHPDKRAALRAITPAGFA